MQKIIGDLPQILQNTDNLYEGTLADYFRVVFKEAKNLRNPYHNFRHICHVLWMCYQACIFYKDKLSKREMRNLLIAALFHDFDHTGKPVSDKINVSMAVAGIKKHVAQEDESELNNIVAIIEATEWPYSVSSEKMPLLAQIIRDADHSQALNVAWIQEVVFGLSTEWEKSPADILKNQVDFLSNLKFYTSWGQEMFPQGLIQNKIQEVEELWEILEF